MPSENSDYQKYLDEKFHGLQKMIEQHHAYNKLELKQIKQNTERTNGKVADHEKRLREVENMQYSCPIKQIQKEHERMKSDTESIRVWSKMVKGGFIMALVTTVGLIFRILGII